MVDSKLMIGAYPWNGAGRCRGGAGSGRGSQWNGLSGVRRVDVTNSRSALALASIHPILSSTHALQIQKGKHVILWLLYPLLLGSSSHAMCFLYASVPPNIQYLCQWRSNTEFTGR
jgi:hypothetical protein